MKINWKYIILFLLIALGLSFLMQTGYFDEYFQAFSNNTFLSGSTYLIAGFSTLIAGIIGLAFHKNLSNRIIILGDEKIKNLLILVLPIISFSIVGLNNKFSMNKSLYGFAFASINTLYAFTEEFGWRRYLQNALED